MPMEEQILIQERSKYIDRLKRIEAVGTQSCTDSTKLEQFRVRISTAELFYKNIEKLSNDILPFIINCETLSDAQRKTALAREKDVNNNVDDLYFRIMELNNRLFGQATTTSTPPSNILLPKIELSVFNGKYSEFLGWNDLFVSLVHSNSSLSDVQKFQFLLKSLVGPPLELVRPLPISAANYSVAYNEICARYSNKRIIATSYWQTICQLPDKIPNTSEAIFKTLSTMSECLAALNQLGLPTDQWSFVLVDLMFKKLDKALCTTFETTIDTRSCVFPSYDQLKAFLENHARALEAVDFLSTVNSPTSPSFSRLKPPSKPQISSDKPPSKRYTFTQLNKPQTSSVVQCPCCAEHHSLFRCETFKSKPVFDRHSFVKANKLCFNCLASHSIKDCLSTSTCRACQAKHHTLLHFDKNPEPTPIIGTVTCEKPSNSTVLLSTALIKVRDTSGNFLTCRALIDSGSHMSVMSQKCAEKLKLSLLPCQTRIQWLDNISVNRTKGTASTVIRSFLNSDEHQVKFAVMPVICEKLPLLPVDITSYSYLNTLVLADPTCATPSEIDILLGADVYSLILLGGLRKGAPNQPVAVETTLGWILTGNAQTFCPSDAVQSFFICNSDQDINQTMARFWEIESLPSKPLLHPEEQLAEDYFVSSLAKDQSGKFVVSLPFREPQPSLGSSYDIALDRLLKLEKRLAKNHDLRNDYHQFMSDYLSSGYMSPSDAFLSDPDGQYFIPHHCVFKPDSTTSRTRVVFDASCKSSNGLSLNDILLAGPKLQSDLSQVLLAFRKHAIVFTADIKAMFLQIFVTPEHRKYQKILWRFSESDPVQTFLLNTVTFGLKCSPFLAQRCIKQLSLDHQQTFPLASRVLEHDVYVDDVVSGCTNLEEALKTQRELLTSTASVGFALRKWSSNDPRLLEALPADLRDNRSLSLDNDSFIKILGMQWNPQTDTFSFKVNVLDRSFTKRTILSEIARIFDPLGFLAPLTLFAKHLMQKLWALGLDWDETPPSEILSAWERYLTELPQICSLHIPRRLIFDDPLHFEVHAFCDASQVGYASVVYFRTTLIGGEVKISLVTSKTRVAPLKTLSIPRLELCAALLGADLVNYVLSTYNISLNADSIYCWSDSSITLNWIKSSPHKWKVFVANRVAHIQEKVPPQNWHHVLGVENPADYASRGLLPRDLLEAGLWWNGPQWLQLSKECWPLTDSLPELDISVDLELAKPAPLSCVVVENKHFLLELLEAHSNISKIQRVTSYIVRFANNCKGFNPQTGRLSVSELNSAIRILVKVVQEQCFSTEIGLLKSNKLCAKPIQKLSPFLDNDGLVRVGGRLRNADVPFSSKHPLLLPRKHRFTELIIDFYHRLHCHVGPQILLSILSQQYWILSSKRAIRSVLSKCLRCFKTDPKTLCPPMADLPSSRVTMAKAFVHTGLDYAGPFTITLGKHRGAKTYKAYLCLFICFVTKAVHLELTSDLSSETFIGALRRFIGRRGRVAHLYSDCGTNFVGADGILKGYIQAAAVQMDIEWHFNPPSSPHMGGLWERNIRTIKSLLFRTIGTQTLTFEELSTIFIQIEATINSRPLYPLSADPNDLRALTPAHFLTLEPICHAPDENVLDLSINRLSRWQLVQQVVQSFWKRWSREYLHTLQQKSKWLDEGASIDIGTLVLIKHDNLPPLQWALGRVTKVYPGSDGVTRVALVKTNSGELKRPLVKLCPLPGQN